MTINLETIPLIRIRQLKIFCLDRDLLIKYIEVWSLVSHHRIKYQKFVLLPALTLNFFDLYVDVHRMPPSLRPFK